MNHGSSEHEGASSSSNPQPSNLCSIFRVPPNMRMSDEYNYIPKLVSIGPLHRKTECLQAMAAHKLRFRDRFLNRIGRSLDSLQEYMKKLEKQTRESYFEDFDMTSDDFVEMMIIDGCFVVELLRSFHEYNAKKNKQNTKETREMVKPQTGYVLLMLASTENPVSMRSHGEYADPIFSTRFMLPVLKLDLLLFENQLPLFVLQELHNLTASNQHKIPLIKLAIEFFPNLHDVGTEVGEKHEHLLALFQSIFIKRKKDSTKLISGKWFRSAMELMCTGIKIEQKDGFYLEVEFDTKRKKLKIPPLVLDGNTLQILRNAAAYEQCNKSVKSYFTSLLVFFDCLVDSAQEVKYLRQNDIIAHFGGSDEKAAEVINKLAEGVILSEDECYISDEVVELQNFTKSRWVVWRADLSLHYFLDQHPINILLFYLTIIQTISSLYQIIFSSITKN